MRLADIIGMRPVVGAGLFAMLTRRCPLHCAHCSTGSTMASGHADAGGLRRFFASFTVPDHPAIAVLTGGEPLLRPRLVAELARTARAAGTRTAVLTGAFFARGGRVPAPVMRAASAVDHFSVSLDAFHEREVPRAAVFQALRQLIGAGVPVSLHIVGRGPADPYLADVTADVRRAFGDRVPMLVSEVRAAGRAAAWAAPSTVAPGGDGAQPCAMAAWPVVAVDGTVVACCNQSVVDGPARPDHLRLGHVGEHSWPEMHRAASTSPALRMIRVLGPRHLIARGAAPGCGGGDYCGSCRNLAAHPEALRWAAATGTGPVGELLDGQAARQQAEAGPAAFLRRYGCAPYAALVDVDAPRAREVRA